MPLHEETVPMSASSLTPMGQARNSFEPNEAGDWMVEADFNNGVVVRETVNVPFMVIPESPIGVIALLGSSLAAIGIFALRKRVSGP